MRTVAGVLLVWVLLGAMLTVTNRPPRLGPPSGDAGNGVRSLGGATGR